MFVEWTLFARSQRLVVVLTAFASPGRIFTGNGTKTICHCWKHALSGATTVEVVVLPLYELIEAIKSNNFAEAKDALDRNADPNGKDFAGLSMLQLAEKHHANNLVPLLVQYRADLFVCIGPKKESLLHLAARKENVGFACALLDARLTPNLRNALGEVPLHIAARTGQSYLARYLTNHNADVLIQDSKGRTPLGVAFAAKQYELVRLLEPIEIHARQFGSYQDRQDSENRLMTRTESVPSEMVAASENHPSDSDDYRFSRQLQSERSSTTSDVCYRR